jgi:hypothetical protein
MEAQRLIDAAGNPTDARIIRQIIQNNAQRITEAGDRAGRLSVFQEGEGGGLSRNISNFKEGLLGSDNHLLRAGGVLFDALVPFSGIPHTIWNLGLGRTPGIGETRAIAKYIKGFKGGDDAAMREAVGELAVQSVLSTLIISNAMAGNITGENDPEHPNSVKLNGEWVSYENWGPFQIPLSMTANAIEAVKKTGQMPDATALDQLSNVYNASAKALLRSNYIYDAVKMLGQVGDGGAAAVTGKLAQSYVDRLVPAGGLLNWFEQAFDPIMKDVDPGWAGLFERPLSRMPIGAGFVPERINPTTGEPQQRTRTGIVGTFFRAENPEASDALRKELGRLDRMGYDVSIPKGYADTVTWQGSNIKLNPDEQRAVERVLGRSRARIGAMVQSPAWQAMNDNARAAQLKQEMDRVNDQKADAWFRAVGPQEAQRRMLAARRSTGRLISAGAP